LSLGTTKGIATRLLPVPSAFVYLNVRIAIF
jgi:hypothetical protein